MNKKLSLFSGFIFFVLISCDNVKSSTITIDNYENASFHMGRGLNKYLNNVLTYQKWDDQELFHYKVRFKEKTKSFTIDLKSLKKTDYNDSDKVDSKKNIQVVKNNMYEFLSPNGKLAAYIDDFNLWIRNTKTGKRIQLTFDGEKDYGYATNNAGWIQSKGPVLKWSPKSDKIATFRQDARGVGEMYLTTTNVGHPKLQSWKYALPGDEKIFEIERLIIDVKSKKIVKLKMKNDFQRSTTTDHIAGRGGKLLDTQWSEDSSKLAFISSSRDHKEAHLQIADSKTGKVFSVYKENVETYYESGVRSENWKVLFDSNEFIWYSEKDNWGHIYLYDLNTKKLKNRITSGNWLVRKVMHIDNDKREIFFTAGGKEKGNPYHVYMYKVNFDGNNLTCLTPEVGSHSINPSPNWNYFVTTYSTINNAPISILKDRNGKTLFQLSSSNTDELKTNGWQEPIEFNVKARDEKTDLYGLLFLPSNYKKNEKYPVLNYIYPGPQSGSVGNYSFMVARRDFQALAELGFVVVAVDAMGTPGRSKSFHDAYYGNMGDNGLPDNIVAIEQLSKKYSAMDLSRVGIWGHSGGGFASTAALLRYSDFYDVAVSSSGNHDNRNYEADWGEKWHGLLEPLDIDSKDNRSEYDAKKTNYDIQANQLFVENLKGKLLIAHGMLDDNVPPSNTMLVVDELIKANKDFDLILFPNKRHGYGDMSNYMMRRKWDYFVKHLKGLEPPKGFSFN
ncbi:MAG: DPP IV N-terminal domain-containing protein [Flavobacteriaceae bacterium]|nr:S9 family peptidase [Flavobacteriaceae bacterium]MDC1459810.1 S9 family peptidase [Flavobacteriaceae bacterium]MDG1031796.1 DPP IV N-terminal domain-containing protein [Flavobacteriaceae bacterium]MDG1344431.1 DPP IV N-terminal domain-containing protein [Flavobacteriaceae bacterium]MDG1791890.1 DPP IV N-terminal domain-containing protein [Flavobacteriaceae bacterium]